MGKCYMPLMHTTECTMTGYHDYVLCLIPTMVLGPIALSSVVGLPVRVAVAVGGAAAALLVGHAMFVRGPVTRVAAENGVVGESSAVVNDAPATVNESSAGGVAPSDAD